MAPSPPSPRWPRFPLHPRSASLRPEPYAISKLGGFYGTYGFFDSFNPSFRDTHVSLRSGSVDGRLGWVDNDYLSDNQGPILGMIANYKTGIIWNATRKVPNLVRGLKRAGFTGGWLNGA